MTLLNSTSFELIKSMLIMNSHNETSLKVHVLLLDQPMFPFTM